MFIHICNITIIYVCVNLLFLGLRSFAKGHCESADIDLLIGRYVMESNKSKGRRGNNRRKSGYNKENKRENERMKKSRSEESIQWPPHHPSPDNDNENEIRMEIVEEQETSLDLENFDNDGGEIRLSLFSSFFSIARDKLEIRVASTEIIICVSRVFFFRNGAAKDERETHVRARVRVYVCYFEQCLAMDTVTQCLYH